MPYEELVSILYKFINTDDKALTETYPVYIRHKVTKMSNMIDNNIQPEIKVEPRIAKTEPNSLDNKNISILSNKTVNIKPDNQCHQVNGVVANRA